MLFNFQHVCNIGGRVFLADRPLEGGLSHRCSASNLVSSSLHTFTSVTLLKTDSKEPFLLNKSVYIGQCVELSIWLEKLLVAVTRAKCKESLLLKVQRMKHLQSSTLGVIPVSVIPSGMTMSLRDHHRPECRKHIKAKGWGGEMWNVIIWTWSTWLMHNLHQQLWKPVLLDQAI